MVELWGVVGASCVWGELFGGAVCMVGLCVGSCVPPGGPQVLGGVTSSGQKNGPDLPNGAEVHKLSASQTPTGDHSFILFSVLYRAPVCAVTHLYIHTYTKASRLNLLDPIVVCVAVHLLQGPL